MEAYTPRIPADPDYLATLGRAFYNFTYLEWVVVWTIAKLSADGFGSVPRGRGANHIAAALARAIIGTAPPLPAALRRELFRFHVEFVGAIKTRNQLLHAHPLTVDDGVQMLAAGSRRWTPEEVAQAATTFEELAMVGSDIFHGPLRAARP